jgi:hypothetical protein
VGSLNRLIDIKTDWITPPTMAPCVNQLHGYWSQIKGSRACPSRTEFRPRDVVECLPHIFLVDVLDGDNFQFRLCGSRFTEATDRKMSGDRIEAVFPPLFCQEVREAWHRCAEGSNVLGRGQMWRPEKDFLNWEGIVLPLCEPGKSINMLIGAIEFRSRF